MKRSASTILFLFIIIGLSSFIKSEKVDLAVSIRVFNQDTKDALKDIKISITDSKGTKSLKTDVYGKVKLTLPTGELADITINDGEKLSKLIRIDARNFDLKNWKDKETNHFTYQYEFEIMLFEPRKCERYEFLKSAPVIHYVYDANKKDLVDIADGALIKEIEKQRKLDCEKVKTTRVTF